MPDYGNPLYWEERYAHDPTSAFDWYVTYDQLKPVLNACSALPLRRSSSSSSFASATSTTQPHHYSEQQQQQNGDENNNHDDFEIFIPGCGNSTLPARLHADGFPNISCVDVSHVVVSTMADRHASFPEMDFSILDATDMPIGDPPDACFDLIVDKGLLDAVLCGDDAFRKVSTMIRGMHRILKPGGSYVVVSHGAPSSRLPYFTAPTGLEWAIAPQVIQLPKLALEGFKEPAGSPTAYYVYVCKKKAL